MGAYDDLIPRGAYDDLKPKAAPSGPSMESEASETLASTPAERISANPIVRTLTGAAQPIMGAGELIEKPFGGTAFAERNKQLSGMQERGRKALGFSEGSGAVADVSGAVMSPLTAGAAKLPTAATAIGRIGQGAGVGTVSGLLTPDIGGEGKMSQAASGAGIGAALSSVIEGLFRIPGGVKAIADQIRKASATAKESPKPAGEAAEKVTGELQRARDVADRKKVPTREGAASEPEQLMQERTQLTERLPDIFATAKPVDLKNALSAVEQAEKKAISKDMIAALNETKATIDRAIEKGQSNEIPARMSAAEYRQMIEGQKSAPSISLEMADRVRQSIGATISKIHETVADKKLAREIESNLINVQHAVTGAARKSSADYGKYLDEYGRLSRQLERFGPAESVLQKATVADRGIESRGGGDAQRRLEGIFKGTNRERDFKELVDLTKHDPAQLGNLRQAVGEYVTTPDPMTKIPSPKDLVKRWSEVRQSVQKSGLMEPEHIKNVDTLIEDIRKATAKGATQRTVANIGGFFAGLVAHHPFAGSHFARDIGSHMTKTGMDKEIANLMSSGAIADAEQAAFLTKPMTQENVTEFAKKLGFSERMISAIYQQENQPKPQTTQQSADRVGIGMRQ